MDTVRQHILGRLQDAGPGAVVTPKDFLDLGARAAVDQTLARLAREGLIRRLGRGLYHRPRINRRLGVAIPPDPDAVAAALGRQTGSRVAPSDAVAANRLGLSTQVPAQLVYFTDGRSRTVRVGDRHFILKHVAAKRLPDRQDAVSDAVQAIQAVGRDGLDDHALRVLRSRLSADQRRRLVNRARYSDAWVADAARRIHRMDQGRSDG